MKFQDLCESLARKNISDRFRRLVVTLPMFTLLLNTPQASWGGPSLQTELASIEQVIDQLLFDIDRINNPPDHAVARIVSSLPVCGSLNLTGNLSASFSRSFDANGDLRLDPSVIASVIGKAEVAVNATPDGSISSSIGSSLRVCIDLMPWAQYAYYLMIDQDPHKEFWEDSPLTFSERVAGASNGSGDLYQGIAQPVVTFLAMLGDVVLGTGNGVVNNPLFQSAIETTTSLLGNGIDESESLAEVVLSGLDDIGTTVGDQILSMGTGPFQASGDALWNMQKLVPFFPDMTGIAGQLNNLSFETLNLCDSQYESYELPGVLEDALDIACNETKTAIDISADALHTFASKAYEIGFVESRLTDIRDSVIPGISGIAANVTWMLDSIRVPVLSAYFKVENTFRSLSSVLLDKLTTFFADTIPSVFRSMTSWF